MIGANLGSDVQDRVEAYRENPQALQARYTQSQELLDLLAMQKMKSEKDAYARDMQLKMEKKPTTIAQQYEAELAGRTKNDILEGVGGVLKNKQNQAQSNINKVASQGIAGAPAPNMTKMAGGGIIGFAGPDGSQVPQDREEQIRILRNKYDSNLISKDEYEQQAAQIRSKAPNSPGALAAYKKSDDLFFATSKNRQDDEDRSVISDKKTQSLNPSINFEKKVDDKTGENMPVGIQSLNAEVDNFEGVGLGKLPAPNFGVSQFNIDPAITPKEKEQIVPEEKPITPNVTLNQPDAKTDVSGIGTVAYEAPDYSQLSLNDPVKAAIKAQLEEDPQAAVDFQARTPKEQAMIDRLLQERMDMRKDITDPNRLSDDMLLSGLLAGPSSTAGGAFRNMGRGILGAQQMQDKLKRDELGAVSKMSLAEADKQQKIKGDAFSKAQDVKKAATTTGGNVLVNEQKTVQADAKGFFDADKANQQAAVAKAKIASQEFISKQDNKVKVDIANMEKELNLDKNKIAKESNSIRKTEGEVKADTYLIKSVGELILKADKNIRASYDKQIKELDNLTGAGAKLSPEEKKAKKDALLQKMRLAIQEKTAQFENDIYKARKRLETRSGMGTSTGGSTSKSANVNKALDIINNK